MSRCCLNDQERTDTQYDRDDIAHHDRLAGREPPLPQAEGNVIRTAHDDRNPPQPSDIHHKEGIEDGYAEDDHRCDKTERVLLGVASDHGEGTEDQADKQAAGIAQVNCCRSKVVTEETGKAPCQRNRQGGNHHVAIQERNDKEDKGAEEGNPCGKSVHDVDDVKGIGDGYQPEEGKHDTDRVRDKNELDMNPGFD